MTDIASSQRRQDGGGQGMKIRSLGLERKMAQLTLSLSQKERMKAFKDKFPMPSFIMSDQSYIQRVIWHQSSTVMKSLHLPTLKEG